MYYCSRGSVIRDHSCGKPKHCFVKFFLKKHIYLVNSREPVRIIWEHHTTISPEKHIGWKRKGGALYRRVSEQLFSLKEGWRRMKWKLYAKVQRPEKRHLPKRKGWALYRRVSELLLSPKEGCRREWEEWLQDRQRK